jgi:hypothetical protein
MLYPLSYEGKSFKSLRLHYLFVYSAQGCPVAGP